MKKWISFVLISTLFTGVTLAGRDGLQARAKTVQDGPLPSVFIYANDVVYGAAPLSTEISIRGSIDPNGNSTPRVFMHYIRNQQTGEEQYVTNAGLQPVGEIRAIDGSGPDNFTATTVTAVDDGLLVGNGGVVFGSTIPVDGLANGTYQAVLDLREASGQRTIAKSWFNFCVVDGVVEVTADVTTDTTWSNDNAYLINDRAVFVQAGATLTIEPGVYVLGTGQNSALVVAQDAKIEAVGTAARPIVMTSATEVGQRARSQWGGLILNGRAPINTGTGQGEGGTGEFGGDDPDDCSGTLKYVRVEFAGIEFSPDNELNGIAFQGVGRGTVVEHVQVHFNKDDGVEYFGGTVNSKYLLLTGIGDDSLDWVLGWVGNVQYVVALQRGDDADQGFESDNNANNNDLTPISNPNIYNVTLIGDPSTNPDRSESDIGVLLREGTRGTLCNFIVMGFKEFAVDVDNQSTADHANAGDLDFSYSIFWDNNGANDETQFAPDAGDDALAGFTTREWMSRPEAMNRTVNPSLRNAFKSYAPDFRPNLNSPATDLRFVKTPPDNGFFDTSVSFVGGVSPTDDWTHGWSYFGPF